jgi:thioredoxin 1
MYKTVIIQLAVGLVLGGSLGALLGYFGKCSTGTCPLTANPARGALFGALFGSLLAFSLPSTRPVTADTVGSEHVVHISSADDFAEKALQSELPVLVDFYSDSCPPCRKLSPLISELAGEFVGRAVVAKVNVNALSGLTGQNRISGIPAVLFFVNGQETGRIVGYNPKDVYAGQLEELIQAPIESNS